MVDADPRIGANRDPHTSLDGHPNGRDRRFLPDSGLLAGLMSCDRRVPRLVQRREGRDEERAPLGHPGGELGGQAVTVLDAAHTGGHRGGDAPRANGMGGDGPATSVGRGDRRPQFRHREAHIVGPVGGSRDSAGGRDLDHLGAIADELPDRPRHGVGAVSNGGPQVQCA